MTQCSDLAHEMHIQHLGRRMESAMAAGNRQEAMDWMQAQTLAIAKRSPAQIARMTVAIDRAIDEGVTRDGAQLRKAA